MALPQPPPPFPGFPSPPNGWVQLEPGQQEGQYRSVDCHDPEVSPTMGATLGIIGQVTSSLRLSVPSSLDGGEMPTCLAKVPNDVYTRQLYHRSNNCYTLTELRHLLFHHWS